MDWFSGTFSPSFENAIYTLAYWVLIVCWSGFYTEISKFLFEQKFKMASYMAPGAEITEEKLQEKGNEVFSWNVWVIDEDK